MKIYASALFSVALLFIAHMFGGSFDLYRAVSWYDIPMHVLGGLGIGLSAFAVLRTHPMRLFDATWKVVILVFLGGLAWEIFEAYFGIAGAPIGTKAYYIDTVKDLIDDTIGGLIAVYIVKVMARIV